MMFFKYRKMFIRFCGNHIIFIILANKFRSPNYVCKNNCGKVFFKTYVVVIFFSRIIPLKCVVVFVEHIIVALNLRLCRLPLFADKHNRSHLIFLYIINKISQRLFITIGFFQFNTLENGGKWPTFIFFLNQLTRRNHANRK